MAIYRESPPIWRRYMPLIVALIVIVVTIVILIGLSRLASPPTAPTDKAGNALDVIGQSLDLFSIEYPKVAQGTPVSQTGAGGALDRAQSTFTGAESDLRALNAQATSALGNDLAQLKAAISTPSTHVDSILADAAGQLAQLRKMLPTPAS